MKVTAGVCTDQLLRTGACASVSPRRRVVRRALEGTKQSHVSKKLPDIFTLRHHRGNSHLPCAAGCEQRAKYVLFLESCGVTQAQLLYSVEIKFNHQTHDKESNSPAVTSERSLLSDAVQLGGKNLNKQTSSSQRLT